MALELRDCSFFGPALPEPFVKFQLEDELKKRKLLPKAKGKEGRLIQERWEVYWRKLRSLGEFGQDLRVANHVLSPLAERLGYDQFEPQSKVITREGPETGGWLFTNTGGRALRAWSVALGTDLDAPNQRGRAYRFSPSRVAQRVLLARGERIGLITDGEEIRILLCDPARPDSHIAIRLDLSGGWRATRIVPDSYRLLLSLGSPDGVRAISDLTEAARLAQTTVTNKLRLQARRAIEGFLQELLDNPDNLAIRAEWKDSTELARVLWREGLIIIYRLLFIFKLESSADPARAFSFAATSMWRRSYSPSTALADTHEDRNIVLLALAGRDTGGLLESGLRTLWRMFAEGLSSSELEIKPLGGMLFGRNTTPLIDRMAWGERAVAKLLDALLWTRGDGKTERERVHYGTLDVEDLGRVYEALLELEPGIATERMCRLRRAKIEVVVPLDQGAPYRSDVAPAAQDEDGEADDLGTVKAAHRGGKTRIQFVKEIPEDRFFLRVGLGRKASGSYYTPQPFVRFLVQETLGPQLAERSPKEDPHPGRILEIRVLDPATGSGHFLVEACRFLGEALYESCRLCDELAIQAEEKAEKATGTTRENLIRQAAGLRNRVEDLPDPENKLLAYMPSRATDGEESGLSQKKAEALCRRLVAVHCLYGVDKNPLAVELAKLSLWLESYAEGLPLTFMDHRLIRGDSLTGPFFEQLLTYPKSGERLDDLFAQGLSERLHDTLAAALVHVQDLEASIGKDVADLEHKRTAKQKLDRALTQLKTLAAAWSGGAMLGDECDDAGYQALAEAVVENRAAESVLKSRPRLRRMIEAGKDGVAFELAFPEVFAAEYGCSGFDVVLGNPPWDKLRIERRDFLAAINPEYLAGKEAAGVGDEHVLLEAVFRREPTARAYALDVERTRSVAVRLVSADSLSRTAASVTGDPDLYRLFLLRSGQVVRRPAGYVGLVLGGGLAKVPADTSLRIWLFNLFRVDRFIHFVNLKQLFGGASSRISFVCLSAMLGTADSDVTMGLDCLEFTDLLAEGRTIAVPAVDVRRSLASDGDLTKLVHSAQGNVVLRSDTNAFEGLRNAGIVPRAGVHRTSAKEAFEALEEFDAGATDARQPSTMEQLLQCGFAPLYGGRSMRDYDPLPLERSGKWEPAVKEIVRLSHPLALRLVPLLGHYRFSWRATCGLVATNERSARAVILPPGAVAGNTMFVEHAPADRPNYLALKSIAVFNAFAFDFAARRVVQANLNLGVLKTLPWVSTTAGAETLLCHASLRLSCATRAYKSLWKDQLGDAWREPTRRYTWPALEDDNARWQVRAAIDAIVAEAFGLDRRQYERVLSTFSHKNFPTAPHLCLAAFDELCSVGIDAFCRGHDPYWDIPLNKNSPVPVIDLSVLGDPGADRKDLGPLFDWSERNTEGVLTSVDNPEPSLSSKAVPTWQRGQHVVSTDKTVKADTRCKEGRSAQARKRKRTQEDDQTYAVVVDLLEERRVISSKDAQAATGLDAAGVRRHLKRLVEEGRATTEGQRRGMKYRSTDVTGRM